MCLIPFFELICTSVKNRKRLDVFWSDVIRLDVFWLDVIRLDVFWLDVFRLDLFHFIFSFYIL